MMLQTSVGLEAEESCDEIRKKVFTMQSASLMSHTYRELFICSTGFLIHHKYLNRKVVALAMPQNVFFREQEDV